MYTGIIFTNIYRNTKRIMGTLSTSRRIKYEGFRNMHCRFFYSYEILLNKCRDHIQGFKPTRWLIDSLEKSEWRIPYSSMVLDGFVRWEGQMEAAALKWYGIYYWDECPATTWSFVTSRFITWTLRTISDRCDVGLIAFTEYLGMA